MNAEASAAPLPLLAMVVPGIVEMPADSAQPFLKGARCSACSMYFFPTPPRCRKCLGPIESCAIGSEGTIYSYTIIRTRPPLGLPQPYALGEIDVESSGLRLFCLLDPALVNELHIGLRVRLAVAPLGHDKMGAACLRPYFTVTESEFTATVNERRDDLPLKAKGASR